MYDLLILGIVSIGALVLQGYLSSKERKQLISRIMSKSNEEYEYFQKQYDKDSKELEEARSGARSLGKEDDEIKEELDLEFKKEKEFIDKTEEDWEGEEVDYEELRKRIGKD